MKHFATSFFLFACLFMGLSGISYAAFPLQHQHVATTVSKQVSENTIQQTVQTDPKEPLINPESEMADIFSLSSLLLGIVGIIVGISSGIGAVFGILAIVLSVASLHMETSKHKIAQWGLAAGIVAVVVSLIVAIAS